jgi:hypothetical protein
MQKWSAAVSEGQRGSDGKHKMPLVRPPRADRLSSISDCGLAERTQIFLMIPEQEQ